MTDMYGTMTKKYILFKLCGYGKGKLGWMDEYIGGRSSTAKWAQCEYKDVPLKVLRWAVKYAETGIWTYDKK